MLRRLFSGLTRRAAAATTASSSAAARPTAAPAALLSTRAALLPQRPVVPAPQRLGEPQLDVLKALQKLLPQLPARSQPAKLPTPAPQQPQPQPQPQPQQALECMNRNARRGKKANHGKRAVSSARRKYKRRIFGKK